MNLLEFVTTINDIEINVKLSYHLLTKGKIMDEDKIHEKIRIEFNTLNDYSFHEIAQHILNALQPYCYEVSITPPYNDSNYVYTVIVRK